MNSFEINAVIEKLISGAENWEENARVLIEHFHNISEQKSCFSVVSKHNGNNQNVSGLTQEQGNVSVNFEKKGEKETYLLGKSCYERVGYYKVYRFANKFHIKGFWKSDVETESENKEDRPAEYMLAFDKDLNAIYFGEIGRRVVFSLSFSSIIIDVFRNILCISCGSISEQETKIGFGIWVGLKK